MDLGRITRTTTSSSSSISLYLLSMSVCARDLLLWFTLDPYLVAAAAGWLWTGCCVISVIGQQHHQPQQQQPI